MRAGSFRASLFRRNAVELLERPRKVRNLLVPELVSHFLYAFAAIQERRGLLQAQPVEPTLGRRAICGQEEPLELPEGYMARPRQRSRRVLRGHGHPAPIPHLVQTTTHSTQSLSGRQQTADAPASCGATPQQVMRLRPASVGLRLLQTSSRSPWPSPRRQQAATPPKGSSCSSEPRAGGRRSCTPNAEGRPGSPDAAPSWETRQRSHPTRCHTTWAIRNLSFPHHPLSWTCEIGGTFGPVHE